MLNYHLFLNAYCYVHVPLKILKIKEEKSYLILFLAR